MKTILTFKNSKVSLRMIMTKNRLVIQYLNTDTHKYHNYHNYQHNDYVACYQDFQLLVANNITHELFFNMGIEYKKGLIEKW